MPLVGGIREGTPSPGAQNLPQLIMGLRRRKIAGQERARQKIKDLIEMGKLDPSVLQSPEFETARKGAGYPAMTIPKQSTFEEAVGQVIGGYGKPTVSVGPRGKVRGMTYRPQAGYSQEYKRDLASALSAIDRGANRIKVYQRIAAQYPKQSAELKRILLYTPAESRIEAMKQALGLLTE